MLPVNSCYLCFRSLTDGIVRLFFRHIGVLIVTGLALGLAGSWWAARFIAPLLFQVESRDPILTFAGTAAVLVAVGLLAAWCRQGAQRGSTR